MQQEVEINLKDVLDNIKNSMLGQSKSIACHECNECHCCKNQTKINISTIEFNQIKHLITPAQYLRAKEEIDNPRVMNGQSVYTCPFLSTYTGKCEIYYSRFVVCASHGVVASNAVGCDTTVSKAGTMIVNPMNTFVIAARDKHTEMYLSHVANTGEETDILDEFKKIVL